MEKMTLFGLLCRELYLCILSLKKFLIFVLFVTHSFVRNTKEEEYMLLFFKKVGRITAASCVPQDQ